MGMSAYYRKLFGFPKEGLSAQRVEEADGGVNETRSEEVPRERDRKLRSRSAKKTKS